MNRREFSKTSGLIGLGLATGTSVTAREAIIANDQDYYRVSCPSQVKMIDF